MYARTAECDLPGACGWPWLGSGHPVGFNPVTRQFPLVSWPRTPSHEVFDHKPGFGKMCERYAVQEARGSVRATLPIRRVT